MPIRNLVSILVFALVTSVVGAADPARLDHAQQKFLLDVKLASGSEVRNIVYRKEELGGRHLLQVRFQTGLAITSPDGKAVPSLDQVEFDDLMSRLMITVKNDHNGRLDSIQVEPTLLGSTWVELVSYLRAAAIDPDSTVDPKSKPVTVAVRYFLSGSMLVRSVCERVALIERKCSEAVVSMNPVVFRSQSLRKKWGDVKHQVDAGLETQSLWFSIDLDKKKP